MLVSGHICNLINPALRQVQSSGPFTLTPLRPTAGHRIAAPESGATHRREGAAGGAGAGAAAAPGVSGPARGGAAVSGCSGPRLRRRPAAAPWPAPTRTRSSCWWAARRRAGRRRADPAASGTCAAAAWRWTGVSALGYSRRSNRAPRKATEKCNMMFVSC